MHIDLLTTSFPTKEAYSSSDNHTVDIVWSKLDQRFWAWSIILVANSILQGEVFSCSTPLE